MTHEITALEQRLIQGYLAQTPLYNRAIEMVTSGKAQFRVEDLNAILHDIGNLDAALAKDKSAWHTSGRQPGPRLREALDGVTERIGSLAALVDRRVADLQARKKALLPDVDECIQQRRMLHAYGKSK